VKTWLSEWGDLTGDYHPYTFYKNGGPAEGMTWAKNIQVALVDANVSGFLYWIGAENSTSSSSLINLINNSIVTTKRFWTFAQFSKFARLGAYRVKATSSNPLLTVSSDLNLGGSIATQIISSATTAYNIDLKVSGCGDESWVQPYLTDNANNLTALAKVRASKDGMFTTSIPALSLVSFVVS
jgi:O-glycosyl hydrolase